MISGPDGKNLVVKGVLHLGMSYHGENHIADVYVLENLKTAILGRPDIVHLKVLNSINSINQLESQGKSRVKLLEDFPNLFKDTEEFRDEIEIQVRPDAQPFVQAAPRVVPLPLLPKLKAKLKRLQRLGIIEPVGEPTEWVAPIVVVPKGDGIRLCCDFTKLNESVLRAHFPIPKVESTLAKLNGSVWFSKLDANSGFY